MNTAAHSASPTLSARSQVTPSDSTDTIRPDRLDDALVELLVARAVTRRALRAVLVRDYDCAGCCAEAGEPCFPNCLPTERNTVHPADLTELLD